MLYIYNKINKIMSTIVSIMMIQFVWRQLIFKHKLVYK